MRVLDVKELFPIIFTVPRYEDCNRERYEHIDFVFAKEIKILSKLRVLIYIDTVIDMCCRSNHRRNVLRAMSWSRRARLDYVRYVRQCRTN